MFEDMKIEDVLGKTTIHRDNVRPIVIDAHFYGMGYSLKVSRDIFRGCPRKLRVTLNRKVLYRFQTEAGSVGRSPAAKFVHDILLGQSRIMLEIFHDRQNVCRDAVIARQLPYLKWKGVDVPNGLQRIALIFTVSL